MDWFTVHLGAPPVGPVAQAKMLACGVGHAEGHSAGAGARGVGIK